MKVLHALAIVAASALLAPGSLRAQEAYPNKPVKVIVPFAPGGPSDVTARIIFAEMSKNVGKQFVIENHAGGAATSASRSRPAPRRTATPCCFPRRAFRSIPTPTPRSPMTR